MIRIISFLISVQLFANQGIVVSVNDTFAKEYFFASLHHLRKNVGSTLPIEVWFIGDELSVESKKQMKQYGPITFCNLVNYVSADCNQYKGWQIKPWLLALTAFDEVILIDADLFFYQDPEILFQHPAYLETGCYFFRDRAIFHYPEDPYWFGKRGNIEYNNGVYLRKREFIRALIPEHGPSIPRDWQFYWQEELPTFQKYVYSEHVDSGCIAIDKRTHQNSIQCALELNLIRDVVYTYVYGDKETYWMGCEIAGEPYAVNPEVPYDLFNPYSMEMHHLLDGKLFCQQKKPILPGPDAYFVPIQRDKRYIKRPLTSKEFDIIRAAYASLRLCKS